MTYVVHLGDCRAVLATLGDCSVDSIVTDPPYELGFMGKAWDASGIAYDRTVWEQCLRVLKPGGHLIAFGGSRTYHRMAVAIEDAGFEIRDQIQWIYGSGFPKSLDVSKAMDKHGGVRAEFTEFRDAVIAALKRNGQTRSQLQNALGNFMISHYLTAGSQPAVPNYRDYCIIREFCRLDNRWDDMFKPDAEREVVGEKRSGIANKNERIHYTVGALSSVDVAITAPATDLAKQWHGWGTALKPAHEPAVLARKPLRGTVADNVTQWGTGAINVEATRITAAGRWPSNVIFDEEAAQVLDAQSGVSVSKANNRGLQHSGRHGGIADGGNLKQGTASIRGYSDAGGASRFFYVAKASKREREAGLDGVEARQTGAMQGNITGGRTAGDGVTPIKPIHRANHHPTVKPLALMRYLVRMATPPGGVVLDPFMGSGSTGCAAVAEGFDFVGMDITPEYVDIAQRRIAWHAGQTGIFDNAATMNTGGTNDD